MSSSVENFPGLVQFITRRENARLNRAAGLPRKHWTDDPVIAQFRFCNVNREDDAVTRYVHKHHRKPLFRASKAQMVVNMFLCRVFNHPPSLEALGIVEATAAGLREAEKRMQTYQDEGNKLMRGAYMMGAHGPKNKGVGVIPYYFRITKAILGYEKELNAATTLTDVSNVLRNCDGVGAFVANQVVTDLRYTPQFECAEDWGTFLTCGPGTRRGINTLHGRPVRQALSEEQAYKEIMELRPRVEMDKRIRVLTSLRGVFSDPNNLSNCMCEFDKYVRGHYVLAGKENDGMSRLRVYNPQA